MNVITRLKELVKDTVSLTGHLDPENAEIQIRNNVYFRGPNAWILAFSVVIASVGLNVNSIPVIIGAMLVSPLMGPIFGVGFALGTNDKKFMVTSLKNLVVMMSIALLASALYFLITPLTLSNPTELLARTNPTIYDVLIALFGGAAGMFEQCRKEKGTVLSGVAIATALMPPLCTAGYGLANGNLSHFFGALYLFAINCVFIAIATYVMTKSLGFRQAHYHDIKVGRRTRVIMMASALVFIIPSILSAIVLIKNNDFDTRATAFVQENKSLDNAIIYDYIITHERGDNMLEIYLSGEKLDEDQTAALIESANEYGIKPTQICIKENKSSKNLLVADIVKDIYANTEKQLIAKEQEVEELKKELNEYKNDSIPFLQIAREAKSFYPEILSLGISRGSSVSTDSLAVTRKTFVNASVSSKMKSEAEGKLLEWLRIRLKTDEVELTIRIADKSDRPTRTDSAVKPAKADNPASPAKANDPGQPAKSSTITQATSTASQTASTGKTRNQSI